jgi:hypothetical protein
MYRIPADVLSAVLDGEAVLLHVGTKNYFRLNETGAAIWKGMERGLSPDELRERMCAEFDVAPEQAATELDRFLAELERRGLVLTGPGAG